MIVGFLKLKYRLHCCNVKVTFRGIYSAAEFNDLYKYFFYIYNKVAISLLWQFNSIFNAKD